MIKLPKPNAARLPTIEARRPPRRGDVSAHGALICQGRAKDSLRPEERRETWYAPDGKGGLRCVEISYPIFYAL